jgi:transcriptional regulator with XRE-family HTH domain/lipopolysaccharide biosynthesis regulator YciM
MPRQKARHIDNPASVGERLREARRARGLSQRDLSFPGCTAAYISRIETGGRVPSLQLLREFGRKLGVSAEFLATGAAEAPLSPVEEAELLLRLGEKEQAELAFRTAAASEDSAIRARGEGGLAAIAYEEGRLEEAVELLQSARALAGKAWLEFGSAPETLVRALALTGRLEEAIATAEAMLRETRDDQPVARERAQMLLANSLIDNGSFDRAAEVLAAALSADESAADPLRLAQLLWSQSRLHSVRGEHDLAASYARRALGVIELTEHISYIARGRQVMAYIENERGEPERALELLDAGWREVLRTNDQYLAAIYRIERARALVRLDRTDEAREVAIEVLAATDGLGLVDSARAFATLATVLAATGEEEHALRAFESAAEQLEQVGSPLVSDVYTSWSELLDRLGRRDEAYKILRRAVEARSGRAARGGR